MASVISLMGRILLALIFILSGVSKIGGYAATVQHMAGAGVPVPALLAIVAILVELLCGLCLATGFRARLAALMLAVFLVPVTYFFHYKQAFDAVTGLMTDRGQMIHIMKNLAIIGGLLMVWGNGAGKLTIGKDS